MLVFHILSHSHVSLNVFNFNILFFPLLVPVTIFQFFFFFFWLPFPVTFFPTIEEGGYEVHNVLMVFCDDLGAATYWTQESNVHVSGVRCTRYSHCW